MTTGGKPTLIEGGIVVDDRGQTLFANGLDLASVGVRRVYLVRNHQPGLVRAWHGHRKEEKYVMAVAGSALVCAVWIGNWRLPSEPASAPAPDPAAEVHRVVLSALRPAVLHIPAGYANGWMSLTPDCQLLFLSTLTLEESQQDDYRFPARYWNPWEIEER